MNMDYSKAFELLNQDIEKERNKKAEKAVHDNLYNKGFRDGLAVLDKIRAEILKDCGYSKDYVGTFTYSTIKVANVFQILDSYKDNGGNK